MGIKRLIAFSFIYTVGIIISIHLFGIESKAFGPGFLCGVVATIVGDFVEGD